MTGCQFIAEVSSNHNGDLSRTLEFVDVAKEIGCDGIKYQLFKIDQLFAPEILKKSQKHRERGRWEFPVDFLGPLSERCEKLNIRLGFTPFYLSAVDELDAFIDFYKIASYEILWREIFERCSTSNKPIVFSTGMATLDECKNAFSVLKPFKNEVTVLHCVSNYPTRASDCNLAAISLLRKTGSEILGDRFKGAGWSDHTCDPAVIYQAVLKHGASMVEVHLDLDGQGWEFSGGHCWLPKDLEKVISDLTRGFTADGVENKLPVVTEANERKWRADPTDGLRPFLEVRKNY